MIELLGILCQQILNLLWWDRITDHHTVIYERGYEAGFQSGFLHGQQEVHDSEAAEQGGQP